MPALPILWLAAGVVLAVAELLTLDFVLIMFAAGAFAAAAAGLVVGLPLQVFVFASVSTLGLLFVRPAVKRVLHRSAETARMGVEAVQGSTATVVEQVADNRGMVKIDGELWQARPYDAGQVINPGEAVWVVAVDGATAFVRRVEPRPW